MTVCDLCNRPKEDWGEGEWFEVGDKAQNIHIVACPDCTTIHHHDE